MKRSCRRILICMGVWMLLIGMLCSCNIRNKEDANERTAQNTVEQNSESTDDDSEHYPVEEISEEYTQNDTQEMQVDSENSQPPGIPQPLPDDAMHAEPDSDALVLVRDYIPDVQTDLRYATENNFTGKVIYHFSEAYLRYGTVKKLSIVQDELAKQGLGLKLWDAFRPTQAQFALWKAYPDPAYVANPYRKYSSHSTGGCVDITLVSSDGREVVMPTDFDDFSDRADRDYDDCSQEAAEHALLLEKLMTENGFRPYEAEWWHFTDMDEYPVETEFIPER